MTISSFVAGSLLLVGAFPMQDACADVYTWLDSSGRVNVGNLEPPEGARVKSVVRSKPDPVGDAARQNQVAALSQRVRELEREVDAARQESAPPPPAPPVVYQIFQAPPAPVSAQAIISYGAPAAPYGDDGCNPSWAGCALWWGPAFVANSFNGRSGRFHHFNGFNRGGFPSRPPMHPQGFRATVR